VKATLYVPAGTTVEVIDRAPDSDPPAGPTWTMLGEGGPVGAYFHRSAVLPGGDLWMAWGGSFVFRRASGLFERTSQNSGIGWDIGKRENYGACYDAARNRVLVGAGGPVAYNQLGTLAMDPASGVYTEVYPTVDFERGDAPLLVRGDDAYTFGGWANTSTRKRNLVTGAITAYGGTGPRFTRQSERGTDEQESPRLTYARAGIRADGTLWALANDNEYWTCPLGGAWQLHATTGDAPTTIGIVATVVESRGTLVAWCGRTGMTTPGTTLRQTWLLDLATLAWRKGPGPDDVVPPASGMSAANLLSDGDVALLVVDRSGLPSQVWALQWA
jgi:hypothetical protein